MFRITGFSVLAGGLLLCVPAIGASLQITTASVPTVTQYQPYSTTLAASGGTPPYTWSVVTDTGVSLPEGMTLNPATGVVSATQVNGQGGYSVTIQVTDNASPSHAVATATLDFGVYSDTSLGGCQIFPADSIYNQRVDQLPVDTTPSHQIPSSALNSPLHPDFGHGFYPIPGGIPWMRVPANQPVANVILDYDGQVQSAGTYSWPLPAWPNALVEGTNYGGDGNDHHVLILQSSVNNINGPQTGPCTLYETYQSTAVQTMYTASTNTWDMGAGVRYVSNSNQIAASQDTLDTGAQDSAGVPVMPLLLRYSDVPLLAQHPLRITFSPSTNWFVWPATGCCSGSGNPQGLLYRLKASVNWQAACPVSSYPQAATLLQALQQYGAYMSDHGSNGYIQGVPDIRWNDDDLACIKKFHVSDLEVVNNSALEVSDISGQTRPYVPPATLSTGAAGNPYNHVFSATGGNPATRQWSVSSGALPPGLWLDSATGALGGLINSSATGSYSFSVTASDTSSGYSSAAQPFTMSVTPFVVSTQGGAPPPQVAITVASVPAGLQVTVDGVTYKTPQVFNWARGSSHTLNTPSQQGSGTRYLFANWSDGGTESHTILAPSVATVYTASFQTQYLLTTKASPPRSGSFLVTPSAVDGYYNAGTSVQVIAMPAGGQRFATFEGDLTGSANRQTLVISSERSVTAKFIHLPRLIVSVTSTGVFRRGERRASYSIVVSGESEGATSGNVTVSELVPAGMRLQSMSGPGWDCSAHTCTRGDPLPGGESYPPIIVIVDVAASAASQLWNMTSVSGGNAPPATAMQMLEVR